MPSGIRHIGAVIVPTTDPDDIVRSVGDLSHDDLHHPAEAVPQVQIERAIDSGDDVWVWDSGLLSRVDKRSSPGTQEGFRAIALVPWSTAPNSTWCPAKPVAVNTRSTTS